MTPKGKKAKAAKAKKQPAKKSAPKKKAAAPAKKAAAPAKKAAAPSKKAAAPATKPTASATKPTAPATKPTASATKPTAPATKPTAPATKPAAPVKTGGGAHDGLAQQLAATRSELDAARATAGRLKAEADSLRGSLTAARDAAAKHQAQVAASRTQVDAATASADVAKRRSQDLTGEVERLRAQTRAAGEPSQRCPKCGARLAEEQFEGISIDRCGTCGGIYFDNGEVDLLIAKISAKVGASESAEQKASWLRGLFRRK